MKTFDQIAENVIRNSIRSAVCIDNDYPSAYQRDDKLKTKEASELYEAFRREGLCDLDIYNFESIEKSWNKDYMIPNKDLIILDWELRENSLTEKYIDTLEILSDIINSDQIPFVVIYTHTPDINDVSKVLLRRFVTNIDSEEKQKCIQKEFQKIDESIDIQELIIDEVAQKSFEYIQNANRTGLDTDLINVVRDTLEIEIGKEKEISRKIKAAFNGNKDYLSQFSLFILGNIEGDTKYNKHTISRIETTALVYKINSTTVLICDKAEGKSGIEPKNLFSEFSKIIISNPHNYISLLSLELKDQLRTEFSKIGARFSKIDEKAFFYHINKEFKNPEDSKYEIDRINDFLINSWLQDVTSLRKDINSEVVAAIEEVFVSKSREIPTQLIQEIYDPLIKYCSLITTSNNGRLNPKLQFGDILTDSESSFFICITPHCSCLRPEKKIENNFYFIKGKESSNKKTAIEKAETDHYSFLEQNGQPICIKWEPTPFTMYVSNNDIHDLKCSYKGDLLKLIYCTTLKENFAQRISNESFGYGYKVGIDLPH